MPKPSPATDLLSALPSGLLSGLFAKARPTTLTADQVLFISGDEGDGCYRVDDGLLKVSVVAPAGGERILAVLGPGAMVGELSMISGAPRSASVAALRDSKLSFVSRATFDTFARDNPELYKHVMQLLANRLIDTNNALAATTFLSLQGRVARSLLSLAAGFGQDVGGGRILVRQKITQSDLAAMAGIARENVSRILKEWSRQSHVSRLWRTRPRSSAKPSCKNELKDSWRSRFLDVKILGRQALALPRRPCANFGARPRASVTSWPSAMKSTFRGEVRRQTSPTVRPGCGGVSRSSLMRSSRTSTSTATCGTSVTP